MKRQQPRPWQPLRQRTPLPWNDAKRAELRVALAVDPTIGGDIDAYLVQAEREAMEAETWGNDRYQVTVRRRPGGSVENLSVRRQDRKPIRDWRDLQRIKNELAGFEVEAAELFPADARLVDSANQYWLWCLPPGERFPFGFDHRLVDSVEAGGSKQRPVPADGSFVSPDQGQ